MARQNNYGVIVVGGGIVGGSTAFYLAQQGVSVALYEQGDLGSGASRAAAGLLMSPDFVSPETDPSEINPFARLNQRACDFYPEFLDDLQRVTGRRPGLRTERAYRLAFDEEQMDDCRDYCREMEKHGQDVTWLSGEELDEVLTFRNPSLMGGFSYPQSWINPRELTDCLFQACEAVGVELIEHAPVRDVSLEDGSVIVDGVKPTAVADKILLAAGAWTRQLAGSLGIDLPVYPRKGEMIRLRSDRFTDIPGLKTGDWFLFPRGNDEVVVGATTVPEDEFNRVPRQRGHERLKEKASMFLDGLDGVEVVETWAGLRPYADRKGGPFLGRVPGKESVYVGAGHYKNGITQGPVSGKSLAQSMMGQTPVMDLEDFRLNREELTLEAD